MERRPAMKHASAALLCLPILISACVAPEPVDRDACGASDLQYLVGQPASVLDGLRFSQELRLIQPGTSATLDYRAERLNIRINANDFIAEVACG
ncbi:MAG: hypothetical protein B7Z31_07300 [Rhodobacterales bacterium 12-65-15]|nr:MAG: hypothetical protein B7Z31_07300 [Rhodobacterales bacterium 12-65-15]